MERQADLGQAMGITHVFSVHKYYHQVFKKIPLRSTDYDVDWARALKDLEQIYPEIEKNTVYEDVTYFNRNNRKKLVERVCFLEEGILIYIHHIGLGMQYGKIEILYNRDTDLAKIEKIRVIIMENKAKGALFNRSVLLLVKDPASFELTFKRFELPNMVTKIDGHYNDDFEPINKLIISKLNQKGMRGLVVLHGLPGTGKTSYIKFLMTQTDRRFLFIPPSLSADISSPDMMNLFLQNPDSVLVIEDAENAIMDRSLKLNTDSVSNLLNVTDGIIGECLNIVVICTFNKDISTIDSALLRKGRLIVSYEFKELVKEKCDAICKINGLPALGKASTLAELYHNEDQESSLLAKKRIGFHK